MKPETLRKSKYLNKILEEKEISSNEKENQIYLKDKDLIRELFKELLFNIHFQKKEILKILNKVKTYNQEIKPQSIFNQIFKKYTAGGPLNKYLFTLLSNDIKTQDGMHYLYFILTAFPDLYEEYKVSNKKVDTIVNANLWSDLMLACKHNQDIAFDLIERGANVNFMSKVGQFPLLIATEFYPKLALHLLKKGANIHLENQWGETCLIKALTKNPYLVLPYLEAGSNPNQCLKNSKMSAFMVAVEYKVPLDVLKELIDFGANLNMQNNSRENALHIALKSNLNVVPFLIESGINLDILNDKNETIWEVAKKIGDNHLKVLQVAVEKRNLKENTDIVKNYTKSKL